jgi:6-phosphogluconolactonase
MPSMSIVFVGTYTKDNQSDGVYAFRMDDTTGAWTRIAQSIPKINNPSYLAADRKNHRLFATAETSDGQIAAFRYDPASGALTFVNQQPSQGADPCHVSVLKTGSHILVANYSSGTFAMLPVSADGSLRPATDTIHDSGTGPNKGRQEGPHAHSINLDTTNKLAYGCDLGTDKIQIFRPNPKTGKLVHNDPAFAAVHPGGGPRHFAFHPKKPVVYSINELDCTVTVFAWDKVSGALRELQTITTLPRPYQPTDSCADIHVSADGKFLYGSNRGHDSIAIFAIGTDGKLTTVGNESTQGKTPRNFAIDPSGNFLFAANQNSNTIVAYKIDKKTGKLTPTGAKIEVPAPVCIIFG